MLEACPRAGDVVQLVELSASIHETLYKLGGAQVYNFSSQDTKAGVSDDEIIFSHLESLGPCLKQRLSNLLWKGRPVILNLWV